MIRFGAMNVGIRIGMKPTLWLPNSSNGRYCGHSRTYSLAHYAATIGNADRGAPTTHYYALLFFRLPPSYSNVIRFHYISDCADAVLNSDLMECICEWCGKVFDRSGTRGPIPRYCCPAHRQAAYLKRNGLAYRIAPKCPKPNP